MESLDQKLSETTLSTISRHETQSSNSVREYSDPIPVDLLIDIFSRVDAKSIARFCCVSKHWASILRRPDFTELFLTMSWTRPRIFFEFSRYIHDDLDLVIYSSPQPQNPDDDSSVVATRYHTSFPYDSSTALCGLVLLWKQVMRREEWVICNPVTKESITLPKIKRKITRKSMEEKRDLLYYFGYDPINKQFKVLCMTSSDHVTPSTHLVLTLETGKPLWRRIGKFHYKWRYHDNICYYGKCINGVLYFGGVVVQGSSSVIVSFDIRYEKFDFINIDEDMLEYRRSNSGRLILINYKGKLGVYEGQSGFSGNQKKLVLWHLEDAAKHKWSKRIYELSPRGKEIVNGNKFVGMTSTGELVYSSHDPCKAFYLFYYNLERNTFARIAIHGLEEFDIDTCCPYICLDYVETLKLT